MAERGSGAIAGLRSAAATRWIQFGCGLASLAIMARILGPEAYGVFALAMVPIQFGGILAGVWGASYVARDTVDDGHRDAMIWASAGTGALVFAAACLATLAPPDWIDPGAARILPALGGSVFLSSLLTAALAVAERERRYDLVANSDSVAAVAAPLVGIACALAGAGIWSLVAMELARPIVRAALVLPRTGRRPGFRADRETFVELMGFSGHILATRGLQWFGLAVPRLIVARLFGPEALGFFMIGWRLFTHVKELVIGPFAMFAMPEVASFRGDRAKIHDFLERAQRLSTLMAYPAVIGFVMVAEPLCELWLGDRWEGGALTMQILVLAAIRSASSAFDGAVLIGMGRPELQVKAQVFGVLAMLVLTPIGALFGLNGVAAAVLARALLSWPYGARLVADVSGYSAVRQLRAGAPAMVACALMALAIWAVWAVLPPEASATTRLIVGIVTGVVAYGLATAAIQREAALELWRAFTARSARVREGLGGGR
jgi:O-antigen/teichoic acid export membrane protein